MDVIVISVVGALAFGGLFLLLCPEWWSTSLGTLKEEKTKAESPESPKGDA